MPYAIPPWIKAADPVTQYLHGLQIGSQIAQHRESIDQQAQHLQVQREQAAQQAARDMSNAEIRQATLEANIGLREQGLKDARDKAMQAFELNQIRTGVAKQAADAQIMRAQAYAQKMAQEPAYEPFNMAGVEGVMDRSTGRLVQKRAEPRTPVVKLDPFAAKELTSLFKNRDQIQTTIQNMSRWGSNPDKLPGMGTLKQDLEKANRALQGFRTAHPGLAQEEPPTSTDEVDQGTDIGTETPPEPQPEPSPAQPAPLSGKRVRVKAPNGGIGSIPEEQLQDALDQGYTRAD